jgi:hypothetical protein
MLMFLRSEVEALNLDPFLDRFGADAVPGGQKLASLMGSLVFFVDGFNDEPAEIYAIPEIRAFYARLHEEWPYWLYFADLHTESLQMVVACLLKNISGKFERGAPMSQLVIDPMELIQFISVGFGPMNAMCERAGLSEQAIYERTRDIFHYFNLPFDAAGP